MRSDSIIGTFIAASLILVGCGGSGPTPPGTASPGASRGVGQVTVSVHWPQTTRLIPAASNSIKFTIARDAMPGSPILAGTVLDRPTSGPFVSTAVLTDVPVGSLVATMTAYPMPGAQGVAQATASSSITIVQGQNTNLGLTLQSTITQIGITLASPAPATGALSVVVGKMITLMATPKDAAGNVVMTTPMDIQWLSMNNTVASIPKNGNPLTLTANAVGTANIQVTDLESGVTGSAVVTVLPHTFKFTGSLSTPRNHPTATLLNNGMVLVAGQTYGELYNPMTSLFSPAGSLMTYREEHTATLLADAAGSVLITGGTDLNQTLATAEVFDPGTGTFHSTAGQMNSPRQLHTATRLADGRVLVAGGLNGTFPLRSAELYDPVAGTFSPTGSMTTTRFGHTATLLTDGTVLITGGDSGSQLNGQNALGTAEIYNPSTGTFTSTTSVMTTAREAHTATLLGDGRVLLAGGMNQSGFLSSAEIYNPGSGSFVATGSMLTPRSNHTATPLLDGKRVLVAGGATTGGVTAAAEIFDPSLSNGVGGFTATGDSLNTGRENAAAVRLNDANVLVVGGFDGSAPLGTAEVTTQPL